MAGEKKRRRFRRSRYVETLNQNQIPNNTITTPLDQPSISIDTDRNLDLDLRQTGSRSRDQPRSDPDSENRCNSNKRLSSPIHTNYETVSNKTVLCHDYRQIKGSNFDKSWNLSPTLSFHPWSVVTCSYVKI